MLQQNAGWTKEHAETLELAIAALQEHPDWVGVTPGDVIVSLLSKRSNVVLLSSKSGKASAVLHLGYGNPRLVTAHMMLTKAGLAVDILALASHARDGFPTNAESGQWPLTSWCAMAYGAAEGGDPTGALISRLHKLSTSWFEPFRAEIIGDLPMLAEEPANSALYPLVTDRRGREVSKHIPSEKLRDLMALLPRPTGQHAERLVTVHGDLYDGNVVRMSTDGPQLLIDFEYMSVSCAVHDLAFSCDDLGVMQDYLQEMLGRAPTTDEVEELAFESIIAYHIHFYVLREVIWTKSLPHPEGKSLAEITVMLDSYLDHARSLAEVVAVIRACQALRHAVVEFPAGLEGGGCMYEKAIFLEKMQALVKASTSDSQS
mmetsp:Transcript_10601/g.20498  ORF Transcript_10601/g.20498 Transcript_10601/m.20498 type:complete len:374 (+) Transcript_10601:65-1186(+)